jgi:hypothetical protein
MRTFITTMSLVLTLTMCTTAAQGQTKLQPGGAGFRSDGAGPRVEIEKMNVFVCPRHPEAKATWPARCPMCQAQMRKQPAAGKPRPMSMEGMMESAMAGMSPQMKTRHQMMMNTPIHVYDPQTLLGAAKMLNLTEQQVRELRLIAMKARRATLSVLTEAQRRRLIPLERLTGFPSSMAQLHQKMMQQMSSSQGMTGRPGGSGTGPMGGMSMRSEQRNTRTQPRRDPPSISRNEYRYDYYPGSARERLVEEDEGLGDEEGFGGDEGFDEDEGFGDERMGFGDDEGFGEDEGLGDEGDEFGGGLGDEGFGAENGLGFGEGFGREGRSGNEEGFGGDEGFRGNERFGGGERLGEGERLGPRLRGR